VFTFSGTYIPVAHHWCFCKNVEGRDIWYPLSMADNLALEDAFKSGKQYLLQNNNYLWGTNLHGFRG
jgi:hypothetical protein